MMVDHYRYGKRLLWMLFPSTTFRSDVRRDWYLVPHDELYTMLKRKHGNAPAFRKGWSCRTVPADDRKYLAKFAIHPNSAEL
jgi:hypothetical protein